MKIRALHSLIKKAELEKRADPHNRGIHDPNPFIRYANRHYGFVPQAPDSFLRDANSEDDFNRVTAEAIYNVGKENPDIEHSYGYDRNNALTGHLYDYFTASGSRHNTTNNWPGGTLFGSYPSERKTVALHELGHGHDPILKKERENKYLLSERRSSIDKENYAWDWAGIPEDNPIRQAAMATYYNNDPELEDKLRDKFWEEASKDSESWRSVDPSVNTNGVPMYSRIMDALAAGNNQLMIPSYPEDYIKYYPGIKQHLGEITRANDDLPPNKTHIDYPKTEEHRQYNLSHIYPKAWMW